ncbi:hypothetical protein [Ahrensia sp. R2A130]|uniref:hypothetical protein n=1 Tax=Ahrensia sp. R2A130 TaxID=744979 RepID=UPI0012EAF234|nr:hypothetical protein [Ahrensia sp. R2A130]
MDDKKFHSIENAPSFGDSRRLLEALLEEQQEKTKSGSEKALKKFKVAKILTFSVAFICISIFIELVAKIPQEDSFFGNPAFFLFKSEFWASLTKEIGFATLIAATIIYFVEARHRTDTNVSHDAALLTLIETAQSSSEMVRQDVFDSVLRRQIPDKVLDHILDSIFSTRFSRRDMKLQYELSPLSALGSAHLPEGKTISNKFDSTYIKLVTTMSYSIVNHTDVDLVCPIDLMIPVTNINDLKPVCRINSGMLDGDLLSDDEISDAFKRAQTAGVDVASHRAYQFVRNVERKSELRVRFEFTLIKEFSDNELWTSLYPSEDLEVVVNNLVDGIEWSIDDLLHGSLKEILGSPDKIFGRGSHSFVSDVAVLPHQGINLWWRSNTGAANVGKSAEILVDVKPAGRKKAEPKIRHV